MAQISLMRTKLDQCEIQAGELTDNSVSREEEQTCSDQEKTSIFDLEMNRLKEQLRQRDSEILILKQEKDGLSAELAKLQKHEAPLKETQWNQKTQTENLEEEKESPGRSETGEGHKRNAEQTGHAEKRISGG